ncbi:hypothetical protein diail_482 [Diaporthe ilicicola]|nr:hypothetical protein diail_482 [Diaporthe ilicicola]
MDALFELDHRLFGSNHGFPVVAVPIIFAIPLLLTWLFTSGKSWLALVQAEKAPEGLKRPPVLPSFIPLLGHTIWFLRDGHSLLMKAANHFGSSVPVSISLPGFASIVVSGPEAVIAFFRENKRLSTTSRSLTVMVNAFGCPSREIEQFRPRYTADGRPDKVEELIHRELQDSLTGIGLEGFTKRFQNRLSTTLAENGPHASGWIEIPDLSEFVQKQVFLAVTHEFFGPFMLSLNPTVAEDFWEYNACTRSLFMGLPSWYIPKAYKLRDKMVMNILRWQRHAMEHSKPEEISDVDWEPYYGTRFIRERQILLNKRGITDERARAAENLAFMWATNSNSVPAAAWFLIEILRDPKVTQEVQSKFHKANKKHSLPLNADVHRGETTSFDVIQLIEDPMLQSLYAETLRLRVASLVVREAAHGTFSFRGWQVIKDKTILVSSLTEAMNEDIWNTGGPTNAHPLDKFWHSRFLVDPKDPRSGPLKTPKKRNAALAGTADAPYFTMDGVAGSWIPYGGGRSLCPGRHFAKREIMLTAAEFLTKFDIVLKDKKAPEVDMRHFGFGTMPPKHKIACQIRRL